MLTRRKLIKSGAIAGLIPLVFGCSNLASPRSRKPLKILFDTDIGSDIDDAVALAYLLRKAQAAECQLLGITTVTGDALNRAELVQALCDTANIRVPIYPGIENPRVIPQRQTAAPQAEKLAKKSNSFRTGEAIPFMRKTIRENPGEVTLLAVGPFTNVAALFELDPEIPDLLKELVVMGGKYSNYPTPWGPTEWNAIVDPHATDIVLSSGAPIRAVGLDITWRVSMTPAQVTAQFTGDDLLEVVLDWSSVWFQERELLHFHDPLAAALLFEPDLCSFVSGSVKTELNDQEMLGVTRFQANSRGSVKVANSVDQQRFFAEYFGTFLSS